MRGGITITLRDYYEMPNRLYQEIAIVREADRFAESAEGRLARKEDAEFARRIGD